MISTELFPYDKFGFRLEFGEKKNSTVCYFECQEHLDKYLERYRLDKRTIKIDYRDGEPVKSGEKRKRSVEQKPKPKSKGSSSTSKGRKPSVDTVGNTTRSTKRKK